MVNKKRLIDANAFFDKLKKLAELMKQGEIGEIDLNLIIASTPTVDAVEVPCKMGDKVWGIRKYNHGGLFAKQGMVYQMFFGNDMRLCICAKGVCRGEWGKNIFATKEETENAIEKMIGGDDNEN